MFKKVKIEVNENLTSIFNYINDFEGRINYKDLLQYVIDYGMYREFYYNYQIIDNLIMYHNYEIDKGLWVKPN